MRKETQEFLDKLCKNDAHQFHVGSKSIKRFLSSMIVYLEGISKKEVKRVVSDPYWVRYPIYRVESDDHKFDDPINDHLFGMSLDFLVREVSIRSSDIFDIFKSSSKGLVLYYTLDNIPGKELLKIAKRAKKDSDHRVRMKALKILPHSRIKDMKNDPHRLVKGAVLKKLKHVYPEIFLDDEDCYVRYTAMIHSELKHFDWKEFLENVRKNINTYKYWNYAIKVAESIVRRMPEDEIIMYIDLTGKFDNLDHAFFDRL